MRNDLIDWLIELCEHLRFHTETIYHVTYLIDLYLSTAKHPLEPCNFQLIGATCLLLAAKAEEIEAPNLSWLCAISDGAYERDELIHAELHVLTTLGWNVGGFANMTHFLARACRAEPQGRTKAVAAYLTELAIFERRLSEESSSLICAAAVWLARKIAGKKECWVRLCARHKFFANVTKRLLTFCLSAFRLSDTVSRIPLEPFASLARIPALRPSLIRTNPRRFSKPINPVPQPRCLDSSRRLGFQDSP